MSETRETGKVNVSYSTPELFFQQRIDYGCCGCNEICTVVCISYTAKLKN